MTRIATYGNYQSALLDLMRAQTRGAEAQKKIATQKNATDLSGFGRQSETLTALKGAESRIKGFMETAAVVDARLTTQDLALTQVREGVEGLRTAINTVLGTDSAATLMLEVDGRFQAIRGGLTMRHQGNYIFSGGSTTSPVAIETLAQLAAAPTVASVFRNDNLKQVSRVAEGTMLETGMLANDVGSEAFEILRDIQLYHAGPSGPLSGKVTAAQKTFLTAQLSRLDQADAGILDKTAKTGSLASQVSSINTGQQGQLNALAELVGDRTDADMPAAYVELELTRNAIQASAQVLSQLRQASLLNYLS